MFFRQKRSGKYTYLQIVENRWEDGRSKQRVIVTVGRLDELREHGQLDGLLRFGAKLSQTAMLLTAQQKGELPGKGDQDGATPFAPRCIKDQIEEGLFHRRRDLFSELALVFYDTTSIYFEGRGGETIGQYGHSKDHRPDRAQMVMGVVLVDGQGRPLCCELWLGNREVPTLLRAHGILLRWALC